MKFLQRILFLGVIISLALFAPAFAQGGHGGHGGGHGGGGHGGHGGGHGGNGHLPPDSLTLVTLSGTAIVDTSMMYPMYYLDENGDGVEDYFLNFGPHWYQPDSGNAARPNAGDAITIYGGMYDSSMQNLPGVVVYEINGEFWRDPYDPVWGHHGGHGGGGHGGGGHHGGGMHHDSLQVVTVSGVTLVDTTFMFNHYYLDENGDATPDYFLNFGPPWYDPPSGATRPNEGDTITVTGGLLDSMMTYPMIVVYELNGQVWRDTTGMGHFDGGGWIHRNMNQAQHIRAPFDPEDWMHINPGWHGGGMMMPESLYCDMDEIFPENVPDAQNENIFAAYSIELLDANGNDYLRQGGMGGHMQFANQVGYQLHYTDVQIQGFNIDENSITAKYWDAQTNRWAPLNNAVIDPANNTITVLDENVSSYVILTGSNSPLGLDPLAGETPVQFTLKQNYPNPFNPSTTIEFSLLENAHVRLTVYNVIGQKVAEVVNEFRTAGVYQVQFDGATLPSGLYFYELKVGNQTQVKKMSLNR